MKTALIQILKYQKFSSALNMIVSEHACHSFVTGYNLARLWFSKITFRHMYQLEIIKNHIINGYVSLNSF